MKNAPHTKSFVVILLSSSKPNTRVEGRQVNNDRFFHVENSITYQKLLSYKHNLTKTNLGINRWKQKRILPHVAQHFLLLCFKSVYISNRHYLFMAKKRPPWVTSCSDWSYSPEWLSEWSKHTVHHFSSSTHLLFPCPLFTFLEPAHTT